MSTVDVSMFFLAVWTAVVAYYGWLYRARPEFWKWRRQGVEMASVLVILMVGWYLVYSVVMPRESEAFRAILEARRRQEERHEQT